MPEMFCKCGCGQPIVIKRHHQWRGIPDYMPGHCTRVRNPMRGQKHSEVTRRKLSASRLGKPSKKKGKPSSEETKRKLSEALKRRWQSPEYRAFQSRIHKGKTLSADHRKRIGEAHRGKHIGPETRRKISEANKGKIITQEHRQKISNAFSGRRFSAEHRSRISRDKLEKWLNPEFAHKMGIAWGARPNKLEAAVMSLLNSLYPGQWRYTGDFSFTINGKCPDYVNCNGQKKIIELFGDYWHHGQDPNERIAAFKPFGYETLVIWERELKDMPSVIERIHAFMVM